MSYCLNPYCQQLATGSADEKVILWDLNTGQILNILNHTGNLATAVKSVAFSPNGKIIATGSEDCTIKIWEVITGKEIFTFKTKNWVRYVNFNPNGEIIAVSIYSNDIILFDIKSKQKICTLTGHSGKVNSMVFSPDGRTLFSGSEDKTIKIWRN